MRRRMYMGRIDRMKGAMSVEILPELNIEDEIPFPCIDKGRSLADMTPEERRALAVKYGAPLKGYDADGNAVSPPVRDDRNPPRPAHESATWCGDCGSDACPRPNYCGCP